nr:MAG: ORF1 [TTV-like mini virus]
MPPYRRWWIRPRNQTYRRRPRRRTWIRRRRPRGFIQRRFSRRKYWVRRRRRFKRKAKKITLKEWQPKTIKYCKIKGYKCLFQAGHGRFSNNYAQYQLSYNPEHWPGGGGWSLLVFNLSALWEEHEHLRNWWTAGNKGLPLARYMGCTFKFFRQENTDYIVSYQLCYPMTDAPLVHPNSQPYNMLLARKRIIVPSLKRKPRGKPYIRKRLPPPAQFKNKWYFQQDICRTGLVLLTTTAVDLDRPYLAKNEYTNNITVLALDQKVFQHKGFQQISQTTGYTPKANLSLYCLGPRAPHDPQIGDLHYLGNTKADSIGIPFKDATNAQAYTLQSWGNPFHPDVLQHNIPVYKSNQQFTALITDSNKTKKISEFIKNGQLTLAQSPLVIKTRYNPDRDTGAGNIIYFISNVREDAGITPPNDNNVKIEGFPLYLALWGWADWQKKLNYIHHIDTDYMIVIQSTFLNPEQPYYILIDNSMYQGLGPYGSPKEEISITDLKNWYPKFRFQQETIDTICMSGPATAKATYEKSIEAHCYYNFKFKWGGCPAPMQDIYDPCSQSKFPVPNNLLQGLQTQNPNTPPETELHDFDERHETITTRAIQRIQEYTATKTPCISITDSNFDPPTKTQRQLLQEAFQQTSDEEEEKTTLQQKLQQQRNKRKLLQQLLLKLTNKINLE